jgi:putative tricarboxylic transport membrane protein
MGENLKPDQISGLFWGTIGLLAVFGSLSLGLGNLGEPGSGFFSFLAGGFVCLMAFIVVFRASFLGQGFQVKLSSLWEGTRWKRPIVVSLLVLGYIIAVERMGFLLTSFLLLFVILKVVEKLSWKKAILAPICTLAISYFLFIFFLKANLPKGILGF